MDNIHSLTEKFSSIIELQAYADQQYIALRQAQLKIKQLEEECEHLKSILATTPSIFHSSNTDIIVKSSEQAICEIEIERIKQTVQERGLTLEETKRFDLLVKNLGIAKGKTSDVKVDFKALPEGITQDTLLALAMLPDMKPKE